MNLHLLYVLYTVMTLIGPRRRPRQHLSHTTKTRECKCVCVCVIVLVIVIVIVLLSVVPVARAREHTIPLS